MKSIWKEIIMAIFMGMILPGIVVDFGVRKQKEEPIVPETTVQETVQNTVSIPMQFRQGDGVSELDMDGYLVGVLLAEMPASFETEAFKAQAVVARTYALKASVTGGKHGDGSVCGDSACCQAYISESEYVSRGGAQQTIDRVRDAVLDTSGLVLTYEGELIEATYFSCSGGSTEDAVAVWGTDFPYLRATDSPGEENATHYTDTVTFSLEEFSQRLGLELSGAGWLGVATYTAGGGVNTIFIDGTEFKGTELRTLLELRSTNFDIIPEGETVAVQTKGFGHRVGMSQYGADAMAASGSSYPEILAHYYQGTSLQLWEN